MMKIVFLLSIFIILSRGCFVDKGIETIILRMEVGNRPINLILQRSAQEKLLFFDGQVQPFIHDTVVESIINTIYTSLPQHMRQKPIENVREHLAEMVPKAPCAVVIIKINDIEEPLRVFQDENIVNKVTNFAHENDFYDTASHRHLLTITCMKVIRSFVESWSAGRSLTQVFWTMLFGLSMSLFFHVKLCVSKLMKDGSVRKAAQMRFDSLTCLKGFAALNVLWSHYAAELVMPGTGGLIFDQGWSWAASNDSQRGRGILILPISFLSCGNRAVSLFFIISGFAWTLPFRNGSRKLGTWAWGMDPSISKDVLFGAFSSIHRRLRRLLPLYVALVATLLCVEDEPGLIRELRTKGELPALPSETPRDILDNVTSMIAMFFAWIAFRFKADSWHPGSFLVGLGTSWFLEPMISFAIVFPFLMVIYSYMSVPRKRALCAGVLLIAAAVRQYGYSYYSEYSVPPPEARPIVQPVLTFLADSLLGRIDDFFAGMVCCDVFVSLQERFISQNMGGIANRMVFCGISFLFTGAALNDYVELGVFPPIIWTLVNTIFIFGWGLLLLGMLFREYTQSQPVSVVSRTCWNVLYAIGLLSYELALTQPLAYIHLLRPWAHIDPFERYVRRACICVGITLCQSLALWAMQRPASHIPVNSIELAKKDS